MAELLEAFRDSLTGDVLGPTNLNAKGGSATTSGGFSTNTVTAESGTSVLFTGKVDIGTTPLSSTANTEARVLGLYVKSAVPDATTFYTGSFSYLSTSANNNNVNSAIASEGYVYVGNGSGTTNRSAHPATDSAANPGLAKVVIHP